jgi:Asp-tRNA(Asn)/Glu-tRNA(Gln) amidotransferase A subunit family amidase
MVLAPLVPLLLSLLCVSAQQARPDPPKPDVGVPQALADDEREPQDAPVLSVDDVRTAARMLGLSFSDSELELMLPGVAENVDHYRGLRTPTLDNGVAPTLTFSPLLHGMTPRIEAPPAGTRDALAVSRPDRLEDLAFADIDMLSALIRAREVSCVELTGMYLARLRRLDESLHCVISFTEERAMEQAAALDAELARGHWRGPLHGIPWGAKDLLAAKGYRTTWGAEPFKDQVIELDAAVVERLDAAGAVMIAKLTLGALAWGDVWYGGKTRNPWNTEQGSSGSSAGPASAVVAGGVAFAIGSETFGSIVSPSARCGASSIRPSFGRVSRHGAMALSWSLDKLGPMCRSARDAALVLEAINGADPRDASTGVLSRLPDAGAFTAPGPVDVAGWRVGVLEAAFDKMPEERGVLADLQALGVELVPVELPPAPLGDLMIVLVVEAAEAFHEITLDGRDDQLVRQIENSWPNVFRHSRLVPAVEYLRAQRLRRGVMLATDALMADLDALVHPSRDGAVLMLTNLTGHPTVVMPSGFREDGTPRSISFTGRLFDDARLLALAEAWQRSTDHHRVHPDF